MLCRSTGKVGIQMSEHNGHALGFCTSIKEKKNIEFEIQSGKVYSVGRGEIKITKQKKKYIY